MPETEARAFLVEGMEERELESGVAEVNSPKFGVGEVGSPKSGVVEVHSQDSVVEVYSQDSMDMDMEEAKKLSLQSFDIQKATRVSGRGTSSGCAKEEPGYRQDQSLVMSASAV